MMETWREWLADVEFRDWRFELVQGTDTHLRVRFDAPDAVTGQLARQLGRKWRLSRHMTKSEFMTTALKAVLTAVEHEAREDFKYRGCAVFGPHLDVDALHEVAGRVDVREAVPSGDGTFQQGVLRGASPRS